MSSPPFPFFFQELVMPEMDGLHFLRNVRANPCLAAIPVVGKRCC